MKVNVIRLSCDLHVFRCYKEDNQEACIYFLVLVISFLDQ